MRIIVQKYGGSSVSTVEKVKDVAVKVVEAKRQGYAVVAVVSAMGDSTDHLVDLARQLCADPSRHELDVLLATGEMVSSSLLAMAIQEAGEKAVALNGLQCGIFTNDVHSNARILEVRPARVWKHLEQGEIVVVAGFQGFTSNGDFTTLGRGGSDTTAVALAAAINAEHCEIYTDVAGVFTADPRLASQARHLQQLSAEEMQELAWTGAKVLKAEAVEFASTNGVPVVVRSTFENGQDTWVHPQPESSRTFRPHRADVAGVSGRKDIIRITFIPAEFSDGGESIFRLIAKYDLVFGLTCNFSQQADLLISNLEILDPAAFIMKLQDQHRTRITVCNELGVVSLVGFGLGSRPSAFFDAFNLLGRKAIPVLKSFTTRESLCFVVPAGRVDEGVLAMHEAFIEREPSPQAKPAEVYCA